MQALHAHIGKDGFRLRGTVNTRIDAFSDVVFGFALTLIVVSLEVPKTYDQLHALLAGFVPFAICFALLIALWWAHFRFFRRYGLHDTATVVINAALLFTLLFYVYPLKFLFTLATGGFGANVFSKPSQARELMIVYGLGYAAIYLCFAALYFNAYRQRAELRLNPIETTLTLSYMADHIGVAGIGLFCCVVARLLPPAQAGKAGFFFFSIALWKTIHGRITGHRVRLAQARTSDAERTAPLTQP